MDVLAHTLKSQWDQLKIDNPGIRLKKGMEILGCSFSELLQAEFSSSLKKTTAVTFSELILSPLEHSNQ